MDMMMTIDNRDDNTGKTSLLLELFYNFFRVNLINEKKILPIFTNFNFFRTFRLPGIRLHHIDWKQKSSILRFIWNLIIIMILVYSFFYDYPPKFNRDSVDDYQNAFLCLFHLINDHIFETICLMLMFYLLIYGPKVIDILNDDLFNEIYHHIRWPRTIFVMTIIFIIITYPLFYLRFLCQIIEDGHPLAVFAYFCEDIQQFAYLMIYHYIKYGTNVQLSYQFERFKQNTNDDDTNVGHQQLIQTVRQLAQLNQRINELFSWIFLLEYISNCLDLVLALTSKQLDYPLLGFFIIIIIYLIYIVSIDLSIVKISTKIEHYIQNDGKMLKKFTTNDNYQQQQYLRLFEMNAVYLDYLRLNLFNCCRIDFEFLLDTLCLICIYCIIICQTETVNNSV